MTSDSNSTPEQDGNKLPNPVITSISETVNDDVTNTEQTSPKSHKEDCKSENPQPLIVRIDEKKGWKRSEIISAFAAFLTLIAIIMSVISFNKTRQAVSISQKALNNTVVNDSIINQPYVQIDGVALSIRSNGDEARIRYVIKNYGQLPAMVFNHVLNVSYTYSWGVDSIKNNPLALFKSTDTLYPNPIIISKEAADTNLVDIPRMDSMQLQGLINGLTICYFYGRYQYRSPIYTTPHEYKFVMQLNFYWDRQAGAWKTRYRFLYNERTVIPD